MNKILLAISLLLSAMASAASLDYSIKEGAFYTSEGRIPNGCFGQLMTELNGDNTVAAIYLNRNSLRGCVTANVPYPSAYSSDGEMVIEYTINEALDNDVFLLTVCQEVDGSMGAYCDKIVVRFTHRYYQFADGQVMPILTLEKIGDW